MREFTLDGGAVRDRRDLHAALAQGLDFPHWYGQNLDALRDCLTDLPETRLTVANPQALEDALGAYAGRFLRVLEDAVSENPNLHLYLQKEAQ
ncbi:MAG: barstar family protein [Oscillibacter sp.]|nr:barstar family protein [Oscillibacter sp.]